MAGEKDFDSTALTFWLVFVIGMVLVITLYKGFTGPLTPENKPKKKKKSKIQAKDGVTSRTGRPLKTKAQWVYHQQCLCVYVRVQVEEIMRVV